MKKNILDKVWSDHAISFMNVIHTSQKNILHPALASLINNQKPEFLLDYGCGDGRILNIIDNSIEVDVYDINEEMLRLAKQKVGGRIDSYYKSVDEIPEKKYDAILLSMVLVCIEDENDYVNVLNSIKSAKTVNGKVYIAVTHPCFRDRTFSNFSTSYCADQPFKYLQNGVPFNVFIEDSMPPSVAFTDYHWSLSFMINKIVDSGLVIEEIVETSDDTSHEKFNKFLSPYLIIVTK